MLRLKLISLGLEIEALNRPKVVLRIVEIFGIALLQFGKKCEGVSICFLLFDEA